MLEFKNGPFIINGKTESFEVKRTPHAQLRAAVRRPLLRES